METLFLQIHSLYVSAHLCVPGNWLLHIIQNSLDPFLPDGFGQWESRKWRQEKGGERGQDISPSLLWVSVANGQAGVRPAWCKDPVLSRVAFLPPVFLAFTATCQLLTVGSSRVPQSPGLYPFSVFKSHLHLKHPGFILTPLGHFLRGLAYLILHSALPLTSPPIYLQLQIQKSDSITGSLLPGHPADVSDICKPEGTSFHKFCGSSYIPYDGKLSSSSQKPGSHFNLLLLLRFLTANIYILVHILTMAQTHFLLSLLHATASAWTLIVYHLQN